MTAPLSAAIRHTAGEDRKACPNGQALRLGRSFTRTAKDAGKQQMDHLMAVRLVAVASAAPFFMHSWVFVLLNLLPADVIFSLTSKEAPL